MFFALGFAFAALTCSAGCRDVVATASATAPTPRKVAKLQFSYQGTSYRYLVFTPSGYDGKHAMPALLVIHGAGGDGSYMLDAWRSFADKHGIVLVAPTFPLTVKFEDMVPKLLPDLMNTVSRTWMIDAQRIYLFGYSAGGYSTFSAALLASRYFAAAGVFGCIITRDYDHIVSEAERKTPIAIYFGENDPSFKLEQVLRTRDLLQARGFPVHYVEIVNQDHNYEAASPRVNPDVWAFMSQYELPESTGKK